MLRSLTIQNFALIDNLDISFKKGFSVVTGETGAGKSILLDGLATVLGKRADFSNIKDKNKKSILEATLCIADYQLQELFDTLDLDYSNTTTIRRELLPTGKSRSFINDTPVQLQSLSKICDQLIDIHGQNDTAELTKNSYTFEVIDTFSKNIPLIQEYQKTLSSYQIKKEELEESLQKQEKLNETKDYLSFQFNELKSLNLSEHEQEELETNSKELGNIETLIENVSLIDNLFNSEETGIIPASHKILQTLEQNAQYNENYQNLTHRFNSNIIELKDIANDIEKKKDSLVPNPEKLEQTNNRLSQIYSLQKKHRVNSIKELLELQNKLETELQFTENISEEIQSIKEETQQLYNILTSNALNLHKNRLEHIPELKKSIENLLIKMGMPNASINFQLSEAKEFNKFGKDQIQVYFSPNKGILPGELKKTASGGERSRIMLAIKAILSEYKKLPTIIFDEIDTGISGQISDRVGDIMKNMGENMQVLTITHLPQIAAKGNSHYKVFKTEQNHTTQTQLIEIQSEKRVQEIAEMIGGKEHSLTAIEHAKELLKTNL